MKRSITEKIIILRALQGDKNAFAFIFDKFNKKIYRFIYFKVSNHELAEDLTSQAFLQVWEHIINKNKIKHLQAFIYQVARNKVIDYYRLKEKEELPLIYDDNDEPVIMAKDEKSDPKKLDQAIDNELLLKVINKLKHNYREIIILKFIEDLSINEIAEILEKSNVGVRVMIHRAIKEVKILIQKQK